MRRLVVALLLLLSGCLEYEIAVKTVVQPDGTARRTLVIREKAEKETWKRLAPPAQPYATTGDDENGFTATAELKPGLHPSGLKVLLGEAEKDPPAAEGTVRVETTDLFIATVYRYEERIALGTDSARFRAELPKWLDLGLRFALETLRTAFPEIDFAAVEAKARAEFLPAVERATLATLLGGQALLAELRQKGSVDDVVAGELLSLLQRELEPLGVSVKLPEGPPWNDAEMEEFSKKAGRQFSERFLAPLAEAERAKVIEAILSEDSLGEAADAAAEKLWPTEEAANKLGEDLQAFASTALGAYLSYGLFDSFHLRFRVELPGRLVRTNGDLTRLPAVEWRLEQGDLVLAPPVLFATSFVAREGVAGEGWDSTTLMAIEEALAKLTPEQRASLAKVVEKALKDWPEGPALVAETLEAYRVLRDAARQPPPEK
ncbi:MAG: hypothetical protein ACHQ1G_10745 [Planctomycetota bacterium]